MKKATRTSHQKLQLIKKNVTALTPKIALTIKGGSVVFTGPPPPPPGSFGCI